MWVLRTCLGACLFKWVDWGKNQVHVEHFHCLPIGTIKWAALGQLNPMLFVHLDAHSNA